MQVQAALVEEATESKRGHFAKIKWFSVGKITFLWRKLNSRGAIPLFLLPMASRACVMWVMSRNSKSRFIDLMDH